MEYPALVRGRGARGVAVALALALLPLPTRAGPDAKTKVQVRLGTIAPEGSPWAESCVTATRIAARQSGGTVQFKTFLSGVLGDEQQLVASLRDERLDAFAGSLAAFAGILPELNALELPFVFRDHAHAEAVLGRVTPRLRELVRARGMALVAIGEVGFRHLGSQGAVRTVADLRSLRLRTQPGAPYEPLWQALGVSTFPMPVQAVVRSLEAGQVDAFDGAVTWVFASAWHLHAKHFTMTHHVYQPAVLVVGATGLRKMGKDLTTRIADETLGSASRESREHTRAVEKTLLESLPQLGVAVDAPSPALMTAMQRRGAEVVDAWRKTTTPPGRALLDALQKAP